MKINNSKEQEQKFENPVFEQILKIIKAPITEDEIQKMEKKFWFKNTVFKIIEKDKLNKDLAIFLINEVSPKYYENFKNLQNDKDVAKIAIIRDSSNFLFTSKKLKKDLDLWVFVIQSMVREWKDFVNVELFIQNNFQEFSKELLEKYIFFLEQAGKIYYWDLTKELIELKNSNLDLYKIFEKKWIIKKKLRKITVDSDFIIWITKEILCEDYLNLDNKDKLNYKITYLENILWIKFIQYWQNEKYIFSKIIELISIEEILLEKKIIKIKEKKNQDKKKEEKKEESQNKEKQNEKNKQEFDELVDFAYPESRLHKISDGYNLETITWKKIFISENEKDKFTSKSLENFIVFYNTLYNLWINFLWDKYSYDFKILCNNKFWFNYTSWEWITESKMLSVLNLIWKNIGVPEENYKEEVIDEKWNKTTIKKVWCFKTLWDAKISFLHIKETWIINNKRYSDDSMFSNWAIENKLIEVLCIDQKWNWLNISKWK